jgi:uncharacterized protein YhaN
MYVEGFGKLHDRRFEMTGPVTLLYGPNEAGKSTLLAFIRAMLFGLPARGSLAERHEPLNGGAHGGSLTLTDGQGRELRVERRFGGGSAAAGGRGRTGASAGSVRVHASPEDGGLVAAGAEVQLNALLGGLSADLFRSLFAFSLTELQELSALQAEELSGYLYSAGWGTSGRAVIAVEKRLAQEAERLYRPRGKNQELALAIRAWEDEEAGLRRSREQLGSYNQLAAELAAIDTSIVDAEESVRATRASVSWVDKLLQAEQSYRRLERIRSRISELPEFATFPVDAGIRYERAAAELEARLSTLGKLEARRASLQRELDEELTYNTALLDAKSVIDELLERSGVYRDQQATLTERLIEQQQAELELAQLLERLGSDWGVERLEAIPLTVAVKEQLRSWDEERQQQLRRREVIQAELEGAERQEAAAERELLQRQTRQARKRQEFASRFLSWQEHSGEELRYHMQQLRREHAEWMKRHSELTRLLSSLNGGSGKGSWEGSGRAGESGSWRGNEESSDSGSGSWSGDVRAGEVDRSGAGERAAQRADNSASSGRHWATERGAAPPLGGFRQRPGAGAAARAAAAQRSPRPSGGWRAAAWLLGGFAAVVPATLWVAGQPGLAAGSFATLALASGYSLYRARRAAVTSGGIPHSGDAASEAAERELLRLEQELAELGANIVRRLSTLRTDQPIGSSSSAFEAAAAREAAQADMPRPVHMLLSFNENGLEQLELEADMLLTGLQELSHLDYAAEEAIAHLESMKRQRLVLTSRLQDHEHMVANWQNNWCSWLQQLALPIDLSPVGAGDVLREAERGRERSKQLQVIEKHCQSLQASIRSFQQKAEEVCKPYENQALLSTSRDTSDWIQSLKELQATAEIHRSRFNLRQQVERELIQLQVDLTAAEEDRKRQEQEIKELWGTAYAETLDQFLHNIQRHEERSRLHEESREIQYLLETIFGLQRLQEAREALQTCTESMLVEERDWCDAKLSELELKLNQLRDQRGRLKNELEKLESGEAHADRMLRVEASASEVQRHARRWATVSLATSLFRTARDRYETERQPAVLLAASRYFEQMTEGAYAKVTAPIGEKRLIVTDQDGRTVDSTSLSRGTAEQLYLSMRFAFAEEYGHKTTLPLIMDDVFVNFDPQRLKQCFKVVQTLSERHQVLFFTCHPHVLQAASEIIPNVQVIEL